MFISPQFCFMPHCFLQCLQSKAKKAAKALCLLLVCIVSFAELGANATVALKGYNDKEKDYESYTSQMGSVINDIKASDSSLYRIEKDISYIQLHGKDVADSEGFLFDYNGLKATPPHMMPMWICLWPKWVIPIPQA